MSVMSISSGVGIGIDVAIVALLVILGIIGLSKGFIRSVLSMLSSVAELIIVVFCAGPFAKIINKIYNFNGLIADKLSPNIAGMGEFYSTTIPSGVSGADLASSIPSSTNGFLKKLISYVLKPLQASAIEGATVADVVSDAFASIIMTVIVGIVLFILLKIVVALVMKLFDKITQNKVIGGINRILGLVFGVAKGAAIVIVVAFVMTLLTVIPKVNSTIMPVVQDNTKVAKIVYNQTDRYVEKQLIDNKLVQKWIDNLWENKYKTESEKQQTENPDGSKELPYNLDLVKMGNVLTCSQQVSFEGCSEVYFKINEINMDHATFALSISLENAEYKIFENSDLNNEIKQFSNLDKSKDYIIKLIKIGESDLVEFTVTLTPNAE